MYARFDSPHVASVYHRDRSKRQYHLKNHLGNVLATVSDRKLPKDNDADALVDYYKADVLTASDYYPFGMQMPGRHWTADSSDQYRFGFNGMEKGNEVKGHGNHYTTKFRQYGPRLGRWLSLDPMKNKFPSKSPYMAMDNSPIFLMDPNGDSTFVKRNKDGTLRVTGGNLADDPKKQDKGVYIKGEDGSIKEQVGESLTSHSFVDGDGDFVKGAVINPNSTEGQDFIDEEIIAGDPSLDIYMKNATNGERYDFKNRGIDERPSNMTEQQYRYRGSVTENGKFASARDFGNMGAGIVAGRSGLAWFEARLGFDGYQYWSRGKFTTEPKVTQKAQKFG